MSDPRRIFAEAMPDWEVVETKTVSAIDAGGRPLSQPDRVALESADIRKRYKDLINAPETSRPDDAAAENMEHVTFVRAKKKGTQDSLVGPKTFIISGSKIIGSQG